MRRGLDKWRMLVIDDTVIDLCTVLDLGKSCRVLEARVGADEINRHKGHNYYTVLKSGCKGEEPNLIKIKGLAKLITVLFIVWRRILSVTTLRRGNTTEEPKTVLTENKLNTLGRPLKSKMPEASQSTTVSNYIRKTARLGCYLARASSSPPANLLL